MGRENELVFYMCLFRTVTWRAARCGGEVGDRQTLFEVACAGPRAAVLPPGDPVEFGEEVGELGRRPPPQRGCFWGQWGRFEISS